MKRKYLQALCIVTSVVLLGCSSNTKSSGSSTPEDISSKNTTVEVCADYPYYDSAVDLIDAANLILSGKVTKISKESIDISSKPTSESEDTGSQDACIYTYFVYDIEISNVYKGEYSEDTIKIKQLDATDVAAIVENCNYLFTLQTYPDCYPSLLNVEQSVFQLNTEESNGNKKKSVKSKKLESDSTSAKQITLDDVMDALD